MQKLSEYSSNNLAVAKDGYNLDKIRSYSFETFKRIFSQFLLKEITREGIKSLSELDRDDLFDFLYSDCKNISIEEIVLAFSMNRRNKFEEQIKTYGLFNEVYVAKVIHQYKNWLQNTRTTKQISRPRQVTEFDIENAKQKALKNSNPRGYFAEMLHNDIKLYAYTDKSLEDRERVSNPVLDSQIISNKLIDLFSEKDAVELQQSLFKKKVFMNKSVKEFMVNKYPTSGVILKLRISMFYDKFIKDHKGKTKEIKIKELLKLF